MADARPDNSNLESIGSQRGFSAEGRRLPYWNAHKPSETSRLLTLREAADLFGVDYKAIYALANAGLIDAMQRDGKGRTYYSEAQLRRAVITLYPLLTAA